MYSLYKNEIPRWHNGKNNICLLMQETQETEVGALGQEDPLEKEMAVPFPVFLSGQFHGQRRLAGYSPWDRERVGHN